MASHDRQVFRYRLDFGGGEREVLSLLEADWVVRHGLNPEAVMAVAREGADSHRLLVADVRENGAFLRLLSRVIFENIGRCDGVRRQAAVQGTGHVYLLDGRIGDPSGRVPPDDIIGEVEVRDGQPVAGSYRHNPRHRLLTAAGWFGLPEVIEAALQHRLRARSTDERI
ncbi:hypothetical protein [Plantactinospora sp. DSM 117369]